MQVDLHGYHPNDLADRTLAQIVDQAWEMGETTLTIIHGHGRNWGKSPGFVNTNTGYLGLTVRRAFRGNEKLKQWAKVSTLDCSQRGSTTIQLKQNLAPIRTAFDDGILPEHRFRR